jgi:hypothetical protein
MRASQFREDRAGVCSLGERVRQARATGPCPVTESSLRPMAGAGEGEALALHPGAIEIHRKRSQVQGRGAGAGERFARGGTLPCLAA